MPRMEVTVVKKGGKGPMPMDDDSLIEDAIREVAGRIDGYDSNNLMSSYQEKMRPGEAVEDMPEDKPLSKEDCPDCAAGTCTRPEHMDEDMLREMLSSMGDKE